MASLLVSTYLLPILPLFILEVLILVVTRGKYIPRIDTKVIFPLLAIIGIAAISGLGNDKFAYLKDGWYLAHPAISILVGFTVARHFKNRYDLLDSIIYASTALAIIHLSNFFLADSFSSSDFAITKSIGGAGYLIISLGLVASSLRFADKRSKFLLLMCMCLMMASLVASGSRTNIVALVIMMIAVSPNRRQFLNMIFFGLIVYVGLVTFWGQQGQFADKIRNSWNELQISDYAEMSDINANWRGYEAHLAIDEIRSKGVRGWVVGRGLGSSVYIGGIFANKLDNIPILHNGYVYIILKAGIAGLISFLLFLLLSLKLALSYTRQKDKHVSRLGQFLFGLVLVIAFSTFAITGLYNKRALISIAIIFGMIISIHRNTRRVAYD